MPYAKAQKSIGRPCAGRPRRRNSLWLKGLEPSGTTELWWKLMARQLDSEAILHVEKERGILDRGL
jgi:hypothetical protein